MLGFVLSNDVRIQDVTEGHSGLLVLLLWTRLFATKGRHRV